MSEVLPPILHTTHDEQPAFCAAPFAQLLLQPNGNVSPCCHLYGLKIANLKDSSLEQAWNSPRLIKLRQEFLDHKIKKCASRSKHLACHRQYAHLLPYIEKKAIQTKAPIRLDLRLNGQCNLACVMCEVWQEPNGVYDQTEFWEKAPVEFFPFLREIEVLGGEPFIQRDTFRLINLVSPLNSKCRWSFVTNGSYPFSHFLQRHLDRIELKQIHLSLDSLDPATYAKIRLKGNLQTVLKTLDDFIDYRETRKARDKAFKLRISMCVLQLNWQEIPQFLNFCFAMDAEPELQFAHYDPSQQTSLSLLGSTAKQHIIDFLLEHVAHDRRPFLKSILSPLQSQLAAKKTPKIGA